MNQTELILPEEKEEKRNEVTLVTEEMAESPLLRDMRRNFGIFGSISLLFGAMFTLLFYKAGLGVNGLLFTVCMVILLVIIQRRLVLPMKRGTRLYYAGAMLLGLSCMLTSSGILHFLNIIGILLLLDLSLLHQCYEDEGWDFLKHFLRMLGLAFQSIGSFWMPFADCFHFMKRTRIFRNDKLRNISTGILISIPFLWIITVLLSQADILFESLASNVLDAIFQADLIAVLFMTLFGFLVCYCVICAAISRVGLPEQKPLHKGEASIALTVMIALTLLYLIFCTIQVIYLFAGGIFVLPEGYTFAEYARRGFFELLTVAIINVTLMVLCRALFEDNKLLRIVITCMTVCTYIMIASATYRMLLYIGAYHLTFLRVFVLLSLFIIALILAGVIITEYKPEFPLFRYCVAVIALCYIAFSFSKPDYFIADYLVRHEEQLDRDDISYLVYSLSLDAAPVVLPALTETDRWSYEAYEDDQYENYVYNDSVTQEQVMADYIQKVKKLSEYGARDFNYAKYSAVKSLTKTNIKK